MPNMAPATTAPAGPPAGERLGAQPTPAVGIQLLHHSVSSCGTGRGHLLWWELQVENYTK